MKKTTAFYLGALAAGLIAAPAAWLVVRHQRQKDVERLLAQRLLLQKQIRMQKKLLNEVLANLGAQS